MKSSLSYTHKGLCILVFICKIYSKLRLTVDVVLMRERGRKKQVKG